MQCSAREEETKMIAKQWAALAGVCAASGCVVVPDGDVMSAGDPLDAHFQLTWTVVDERSGVDIDCRSTGADTVRIRSRNISTDDELVDLFDCEVRQASSSALPAGDYAVSVDLVACRGDSVCDDPEVISALSRRTLYHVWQDADMDLGHFVFMVD
jgi:hypothetical protein